MMLTQQQIEERRKGIGGSDVAAILGISPWRTAYDVYTDKIGEGEPQEENDAMLDGSAVESAIIDMYKRRNPELVIQRSVNLIVKDNEWMRANLDAICADANGMAHVLEAKLSSSHGWGEQDSDEVPPYYICQVMWYMMCLKREYPTLSQDFADIAVLHYSKFKSYRVKYDEELTAVIYNKCRSFWFDNVVAHVPPPIDMESDSAGMYLQKKYGESNEIILPIGAESSILPIVGELQRMKALQAYAEQRITTCENKLKDFIGVNDGIEGDFGTITWKTQKGRKSTAWKEVALALDASPELVEQFTKYEEPTRVLNTKKLKPADDIAEYLKIKGGSK